MNDSDLKKHLAALPPPPPPAPDVRDHALAAALHQCAHSHSHSHASAHSHSHSHSRTRGTTTPFVPRRPSWFQRWMPVMLGSAAAVAAVLPLLLGVFGLSRQPKTAAPATPAIVTTTAATGDGEMLAQIARLFPGQLNAVVERNGTFQIDLIPTAPSPPPPPAAITQPIIVQLERTDNGQRLRILSYSGRTIRIELEDGTTLAFDALLTGEGDIILAGKDFLWSPAHPAHLAGYEIHATPLNTPATPATNTASML